MNVEKKPKWIGKVPKLCDNCYKAIVEEFYQTEDQILCSGCKPERSYNLSLVHHYVAEKTKHHGSPLVRFVKVEE